MARLFGKPIFRGGSSKVRRVAIPEGLATKCPDCGEVILNQLLDEAQRLCPKCGYHFPMQARRRIELLVDEGSFEERDAGVAASDPLGFPGYADRLLREQQRRGIRDAVVCGSATLGHHPVELAVMDFSFLGGSMGSVVGEKIARGVERAIQRKAAAIIVCASGGARMHEGVFSLMQMAKVSGALAALANARLPYIAVLTNPTTGGVTASFATLGDLIVAEPGAMIGFAGPRVIRETTHEELPKGFQTAEFLLERGLLDAIISRREMRVKLRSYLNYLMPGTGSR
jgi:acetyl-CoA carboxylase carboxyl transferase subunit beta